jgi:hypothetical protein
VREKIEINCAVFRKDATRPWLIEVDLRCDWLADCRNIDSPSLLILINQDRARLSLVLVRVDLPMGSRPAETRVTGLHFDLNILRAEGSKMLDYHNIPRARALQSICRTFIRKPTSHSAWVRNAVVSIRKYDLNRSTLRNIILRQKPDRVVI